MPQPPLLATSAAAPRGVGSSRSRQNPSGTVTGLGPCWWPRGRPIGLGRELDGGVELVEAGLELLERVGLHQPAAGGRTDRVALEVPADVLAQVADADRLAVPLDQPPGVVAHGGHHRADRRRRVDRLAGERRGQVAEEPGPAEAAPADDHAVAAGLGHHAQGVGGHPDVAVAEHGDRGDAGP